MRGSERSRHLLLVSLGPVQDFIASARRCQDLWYGSHLLSELSRAAASAIQERAGKSGLIFPSAFSADEPPREHLAPEERQAVANKILAVLPAGEAPDAVAGLGKARMHDKLMELGRIAFDRLPKGPPAEARWDRPMAERQLAQLMEYQWVAVPMAGDDDYPRARERAERLLSWRKNTRDWKAVGWAPPFGLPESSLDGQRETVLHEPLHRDLAPEVLRRVYHVKRSERLCGVGLLKRLGEEEDERNPPFHSTAHVTAGPLRTRLHLEQAAGREALNAYLAVLKREGLYLDRFRIRCGERHTAVMRNPLDPTAGERHMKRTLLQDNGVGYDAVLLFPEQLPEVFAQYSEDAADPVRTREHVAGARKALRDFLGKALGLRGEPCPYYAFLIADGDRMGRAIEELRERERHHKLSRALRDFAEACRGLVEKQGGSLIYAGGDDVMALLPLHTALRCAEEMQASFAHWLGPVFAGTPVSLPTLSVGLGVTHYQDGLGEARRIARAAERLAKVERGSLGIVVEKRSGGRLEVRGRWDELDAHGQPDDLARRIDCWCGLYQKRDLPEGVAFDLEAAMTPLLVQGFHSDGPAGAPQSSPDEVAEALARRIIARKRQDGGAAEVDDATRDLLRRRFHGRPDLAEVVGALSAELQVARLFLRAYEDAWGEEDRP